MKFHSVFPYGYPLFQGHTLKRMLSLSGSNQEKELYQLFKQLNMGCGGAGIIADQL